MHCASLLRTIFASLAPFSSPEAALLLVSTKNRDLWPCPTPEVRDSRTSRHSAHAQSQVWQIWLVLVSIYCVYKAIKKRNVVGLGQRSWFLVLTKRSAASGYENALARANERVHVQNIRNIPKVRLDSEIKARFLLNEHGDLYFLLHNDSAHVILFNPNKNSKKLSEGKNDIVESVHKTVTLGCKLWLRKHRLDKRISSTLFQMVRFFPQILYDIVPYVPYFLPVKFSSENYFDKLYFQLPQNVTWTNE